VSSIFIKRVFTFITSLCSISPIRRFNVHTGIFPSANLVPPPPPFLRSRNFSRNMHRAVSGRLFLRNVRNARATMQPASHRASQTGCERYPIAAFRQRFPRWPKMSRARARARRYCPRKSAINTVAIATITLRSRCKRPGRDGDITALSASLSVDPCHRASLHAARKADFSALFVASTRSVSS